MLSKDNSKWNASFNVYFCSSCSCVGIGKKFWQDGIQDEALIYLDLYLNNSRCLKSIFGYPPGIGPSCSGVGKQVLTWRNTGWGFNLPWSLFEQFPLPKIISFLDSYEAPPSIHQLTYWAFLFTCWKTVFDTKEYKMRL